MDPVPNLVALVTGSRTGLGKFISGNLASRGYRVVGASRTKADWSAEGYEHVLADVTEEREVISLLNHVRRSYGRLDIAVNNAGIASMNHSLLVPGTTVDSILAVNVRGTFLVSRESVKLMQKRKWGRIVNLTSVAVPMLIEGEALYSASKGAVETLTRVQAREFAHLGVTVNAVGPSPIYTDLIRNVPRERIQQIVDRLAVKRLGTPSDVMNVIDFFIRPESEYVTGQIIYLGGV